jgi:16S rRNA U516 pseudouridylate synthase RsuA-like enzyme
MIKRISSLARAARRERLQKLIAEKNVARRREDRRLAAEASVASDSCAHPNAGRSRADENKIERDM